MEQSFENSFTFGAFVVARTIADDPVNCPLNNMPKLHWSFRMDSWPQN